MERNQNEVDRILYLLKRKSLSNVSKEEYILVEELLKQFTFYEANLRFSGENPESQKAHACVQYLGCYLDTNSDMVNNNTINNSNIFTQRGDEHVKKLGIVTKDFVDGKLIYLMDGEPIKFKKMKDTTVYHKRWEENFKELKEFYRQNGHCIVTRSTQGHEELGNWVTEQRRKLKKGKVSLKQFEMLNELGFEWDRSHYFFRTYHKKKPEQEVDESQVNSYTQKDDNV